MLLICAHSALSEPLAAPGDLRLRHDLQLLNDTGVTNIPLTAWPISLGDVHNALVEIDASTLNESNRLAFLRLRDRLSWELDVSAVDLAVGLAGATEPRVSRTFENTPREEGEVTARLTWLGERFAVNLSASVVSNPLDQDEIRPDGSYVGIALGNWMLTAGWQDRWFGPGHDGSLILSNSARPSPGITLQRNNSDPFKTRWLSWMGPWTFSTFFNLLDDDRVVEDAQLFGLRGSIRPMPSLEIGVSRAAQWCGKNRPCDLGTFWDLLVGDDNRNMDGVRLDEPGNQLAGFDVRWSLPKRIPVALYMQWIGEDGAPDERLVGDWLRQLGAEYWGSIGSLSHRTHIEVSDTMCREGGFGLSDKKPDCAYRHPIYASGFNYNGPSLGHSMGGDGLSYSMGSTLVQSAGHTWNAILRYMEINREGRPDPSHPLSPTPQEWIDVQLTHERQTRIGRFYAGIAYVRVDDELSGQRDSEFSGFFQWSSR